MQARQGGLGRSEWRGLTIRELFRELVVNKKRINDAIELATYQAYQTVRIGLMVKRTKTTARMPKWSEVIGKSAMTWQAGDSKEKGLAFMQMLAARAGTKVRYVKRSKKGSA